MENNYSFGKSERPWAHELTSQMGGELMSWSPSVSAALISDTFDYIFGIENERTRYLKESCW